MTCPYLTNSRCELAEHIASVQLDLSLECRPEPETCEKCMRAGKPGVDHPSIVCIGLVTPQVPKGKRVAWAKYTTFIFRGRSRGIGDTAAKVAKALGLDKVAKAVSGGDCGCDKRAKKLNDMFPYKDVETPPEEPDTLSG